MRKEDFSPEAPGELVSISGGGWAFVPHPLTKNIGWPFRGTILNALSEAERSLGRLDGMGRELEDPVFFIRPYAKREAAASSRIEGTYADGGMLFQREILGERAKQGDNEIREVENYLAALAFGERILKEGKLPLCLRLVGDIHATLMQGVRGKNKAPGKFRREQNYVGKPGDTVVTATYVPPPVHEMEKALDAWEKFLHAKSSMPVLFQCALMHYQFEAIHPFLDGNGRVGRMLIPMFLFERKALTHPILYLSPFFEKHRGDYYDLLLRVSQQGDWSPWIEFFLRGVKEEAKDACSRMERLAAWRKETLSRIQSIPRSYPAQRLLDGLTRNPFLTVSTAARLLDATYPTAKAALEMLLKAGIVKELPFKKRPRWFVAKDVFDLFYS